jgi:rRNA maturation endonuclease Nob1
MARKKKVKKIVEVADLKPAISDLPRTYQCRGCKAQFPALDGVCKSCGRTDAFRIK